MLGERVIVLGEGRAGIKYCVPVFGSWVVGPYLGSGAVTPQLWSKGTPGEYYYLGGTSMSAPFFSSCVGPPRDPSPKRKTASRCAVLGCDWSRHVGVH
ncbi:hypothetical protein ACFLS5_02190 [Candidatus Bipolaricaulota bacterium]